MTDVRRLVTFIDDTFAIVRRDLGAALRQLDEWTGGFSSAASGAPPATASGHTGDQSIRLTSVEAGAMRPDEARQAINRANALVARLVVDVTTIRRDVHGDGLPDPADALPSRLAFIQWHINRLIEAPTAHRSAIGRIDDVQRRVTELHQITTTYRPAQRNTKPINACHAHEAADLDAEICSSYRRLHLCRWCGDFRTAHGVNPPVRLVRLHDRGISMSTSMLRSAGVRQMKSGGAA
jgi:hypothetical protein